MPSGLTYLIIGQPKTGKTTACASWSPKGSDGVLIIDTDLGSDFVNNANTVTVTGLNAPIRPVMHEGKQVTKNGVAENEVIPAEERGFNYRSGDDKGKPMPVYSMIEVYNWIVKEWDNLPYDTVVIDTIGEINSWLESAVMHALGLTAMGGGQWGADWGKARRNNMTDSKRVQELSTTASGDQLTVDTRKAHRKRDHE